MTVVSIGMKTGVQRMKRRTRRIVYGLRKDFEVIEEKTTEKDWSELYGVAPTINKEVYEFNWYNGEVCSSKDLKGNPVPDRLFKEAINKPKNKIMSKITKFAKDLTLSPNSKELRKANLQDEDGDWTEEAVDIVEDLIAKECGFKNAEEMARKYNEEGLCLSELELHTAFTKYHDQLLDIAKKYNKENK